MSGMFARFTWLVVASLVVLHVAGYYFYGHDRMVENARIFAVQLTQRVSELDTLAQSQPDIFALIKSDSLSITRTQNLGIEGRDRWPHSAEVESAVREYLAAKGFENLDEVKLHYAPRRGGARLLLLIPSRYGGYLSVDADIPRRIDGHGTIGGIFVSVVVVVLIGIVLLISRRHTRQFARFADAAERLAQGEMGPRLPENVGPRELRHASAAFNAMQDDVMALIEERSEMLAGISHDVRTLATRLGLRLEQLSDAEQRAKAHEEIATMTDILDQALVYARLDDGAQTEEAVDIDVSALLQTVADEFRTATQDVKVEAPTQVVVHGEPSMLRRLLMNLVDNALKYGGDAQLGCGSDRVWVRDTGPGIDPEELPAALKPYGRLDRARSQDQPGSGLGLAIVEKISAAQGWSLDFKQLRPGFEVAVVFR